MIKIRVEVLVSTMNSDLTLHNRMNIKGSAIIINQAKGNSIDHFIDKEAQIVYYTTNTRGLSKSRNMAIEKATGDICLFGDDDVIYENDYEERINEAYKNNPDADIIAFRVDSSTEGYEVNRLKEGRVNKIYSMKLSSVQISFKLNSIRNLDLKLDEDFGSGSNKYLNGEENIFLYHALSKKLNLIYIDDKIGEVSFEESTWRNSNPKMEIITKGAMFYEMSKVLYPLFNLQFIIRKRKEYKGIFSFTEMMKLIFNGSSERKKSRKSDWNGF